MQHTDTSWDAIVVGSGLGGLSAAARMASAGLRVLDVVSALGGRLFDAGFCDRHSGLERSCLNTSDCSIRPVLRHLQAAVDHVLGELTLQSLLASEQEVAGTIHPRAVPLPVLNRLS